MDLGIKNVPPENFPYELDEEGQIVDSQSPAGIRLRYERLRKRVEVDESSERQEEREAQKAAEKERVEAEGKTYSDPLVETGSGLNDRTRCPVSWASFRTSSTRISRPS